ncbi:hypothetical protein BV25DRAFT_716733 [Artomyces pyxidatus]|uniref:Uncharacterized protein n=1 Tax=Artomyces pyxidatus TaxID=48021 RepID=A0ACB8SZH5_9AGAM|nr:hypothetical protein BV25DRAFT_716733 [Artomyces pyxidatus]
MTAHVDPTKHDTAKSVDFGAPFDSANADVIIRSSDLVDFRVFKTTLAQASPVFEDIFHHIPSALVGNVIKLDRTKDGLPVICLPEGRAVVHSLLTSIFPVPVYVPTSFRALAPVLAAAQRYQMINGLSLLRICASASDTNLITQDNALEAYCVACYHGLAEEASTAAALTVNQSLALALEDFGEDIQLLSGPSIFALWNYHERILKAAREGLLNLKATTSTSQLWQTTMAGSRHKCVAPGEDGTTPAWLIQCARAIAAGTHKISDFRLVHIKHALKSHCPFCIGISEETLAVVYNDLKEHISACMPSASAFPFVRSSLTEVPPLICRAASHL